MNVAVPFSLSDILERVIPGSIVLGCLIFALFDSIRLDSLQASALPGIFSFFGVSYALGVLTNTLSGYVPIKGFRSYWSEDTSAREAAIRAAIEAHFKVLADNSSWSLCYGSCVKQGYAANVQVFLGLEVFCSSMTVSCALSAMILAGRVVASLLSRQWSYDLVLTAVPAVLFAAAVPIFRRGALRYSKAFVASIYEGFYSWFCDSIASPGAGAETPAKTAP